MVIRVGEHAIVNLAYFVEAQWLFPRGMEKGKPSERTCLRVRFASAGRPSIVSSCYEMEFTGEQAAYVWSKINELVDRPAPPPGD